jgi:hypothetical protein
MPPAQEFITQLVRSFRQAISHAQKVQIAGKNRSSAGALSIGRRDGEVGRC